MKEKDREAVANIRGQLGTGNHAHDLYHPTHHDEAAKRRRRRVENEIETTLFVNMI